MCTTIQSIVVTENLVLEFEFRLKCGMPTFTWKLNEALTGLLNNTIERVRLITSTASGDTIVEEAHGGRSRSQYIGLRGENILKPSKVKARSGERDAKTFEERIIGD